jgi:NDP-4-keto-2,6-dideoxyhexose 3-C-methyltransferase
MLRNISFDNVCHEHIEYYSLTTMKNLLDRHHLEIIRVFKDDINGGSNITVISHRGAQVANETVNQFLKAEKSFDVSKPDAYTEFQHKVSEISEELYNLVSTLKKQNKSLYIRSIYAWCSYLAKSRPKSRFDRFCR